jgi:hypothetical protein
VRIAIDLIRRNSNQIEKLCCALARSMLSRCARHPFIRFYAVSQYRLFDYRARSHARIKGAERVLKNYLHLAPQLAQLFRRESEHIPAIEQHSP